MKQLIKPLILMSLLISPLGWAKCKEAISPGLPNPDVAVEAEMLLAQDAVKHYLLAQEDFLSCVQNSRRYNMAVDRMYEMAKKYNDMARRYKVRIQSLNMFTELALLDL
ncbi:MAG: hypothetical protein V3T17_02985 [Pseudomonadales bacterium]